MSWSWFFVRAAGLRWDDSWPSWRRARPKPAVGGAPAAAAFRSL